MRFAYLAFIALLPVAAQEFKIPPSIDKLADKAEEVVDVTMDSSMLQLAGRFLSENAGEYEESDVAALRAQLKPPVWSRIVGVRSKHKGDNAEVFLANDGSQIAGLVIICADPKELTVVSIVGQLKPEDLRDLGGNFGIPKLDIGGAHVNDGSKEK